MVISSFCLGNVQFVLKLSFQPGWPSCNAKYLFIPDTHEPALHVYTWAGDHVREFSKEALGLNEGDYVWAVSQVHNNEIILHIENYRMSAHFFKAYKLPALP